PKPIWQSYRRWLGAYGTENDGDFGTYFRAYPNEYQNYLNFISAQRNSPRYRRVIQDAMVNPITYPQVPHQPGNANFQILAIKQNVKRLIRILKSNQHYNELKYLIASAILGCHPNQNVNSFIMNRLSSKTELSEYYQTYLLYQNPQNIEQEEKRNLALLMLTSEYLNVKLTDWDHILVPNQEQTDWLKRGSTYSTGFRDVRTFFWQEFLYEIRDYPNLNHILDVRDWYDYDDSTFGKPERDLLNYYRAQRTPPAAPIDMYFTNECQALDLIVSNSLTQHIRNTQPVLELSQPNVSFYYFNPFTFIPRQKIKISNSGNSDLNIQSIILTGNSKAAFNFNSNCPNNLMPSVSCDVELTCNSTYVGMSPS
ncbi:hypothetical protein BVY03_01055, partial [bacterium K02(2017)]